MLLCLIISFLVNLSVAAPVTEDSTLSPVLAKRSTQCNADLGYSILTTDCHEALEIMRSLPQFRPDRGNGIFTDPTSEFSRTAPDSRFRLPQAFRVRGCTILIDVRHGMNSATVTRSSVETGVLRIIRQCVRGQLRTGGSDMESGIVTMIANEEKLTPRLRDGWDQCMALAHNNNNNPFDAQAQCLLYDFEVDAEAQARGRAGMSGGHSTSKR